MCVCVCVGWCGLWVISVLCHSFGPSPSQQASFVYNFRPSESFYARPFGLTMNIYYKDQVSMGSRCGVGGGYIMCM